MKKLVFSLFTFMAVVGFSGCAVIQPTQSSEFRNFVNEYKSYKTEKALAVTLNNNRVSSYGYSHSHLSQNQANNTALKKCEDLRANNNIKSECKLYMEGDNTKFNLK